jgi:hypothetical protein
MVVIAGIWALVVIIRSRHEAQLGRRLWNEADEEDDGSPPIASAGRERALKAEVERLRERLEVLERIATDAESREARERRRLEAEIDSLRGQD